MWLEAILTKTDLQKLFQQFAPLRVRLGDSAELTLDAPSDVTLHADTGVRVVCSAQLRWSVLGMHVPVTLRSLVVLVTPTIENGGSADEALVFKLSLELVDVASIPAVFDAGIAARLNEELLKNHVEMSWHFHHLLDHVFPLPAILESAAALDLRAVAAVVKTTRTALAFAVNFQIDVQRRDEVPSTPGAG